MATFNNPFEIELNGTLERVEAYEIPGVKIEVKNYSVAKTGTGKYNQACAFKDCEGVIFLNGVRAGKVGGWLRKYRPLKVEIPGRITRVLEAAAAYAEMF